ncbi:hypothetical protein P389DRAFT_112341 [Cystobasidium minutum MCA 4210]|uniref:uncharacterized protein n=1 Tax=Cystobasidium minutum MCA 4210 TaxID=1397322 RepID=UPI0034CE35DE|eukprot:jgi/Rhomi1/112341/CE112340_2268
MAATHHGHIICLYAGRAVYCPKMATLQATLKAALECLGLDTGKQVHFAFPHSDLAILVEISALAFKNVRDGAILYLCDGRIGPIYPHELALQAQEGQARRPGGRAGATRAVTADPAGTVNSRVDNNQARNAANDHADESTTVGTAATSSSSSSAAATAARRLAAERSRSNGVRTSTYTSGTVLTSSNNASSASARAARASRRSRRQTNEVAAAQPGAATETNRDKEPNNLPERNGEEDEHDDNAPGPSSSRTGSAASTSSSTRVKRELIDDEEEGEDGSYTAATRNGHDDEREDGESHNAAGDPYFKKRRRMGN